MKILLATYFLRAWTGSELFTATLARALAHRGHQVTVHAPMLGELGRQLAYDGLSVTGRLSDLVEAEFEVAHVHHNVVSLAVRAAFPRLPMVMLLHGVLPDIERPPSADLSLAKILGVSEEVVEHARTWNTHGTPTEIVRNFVDSQHWTAARPVGTRLRRVLVLSNDYPAEMRHIVESACALVGVQSEHVGLPENPQHDVRPSIERSDLVITQGRGVLEALAMERNVIVLGARGGDGFVDEQTFFEFRQRNFSGRTSGIRFTPESLAQEMARFDPELGPRLRALVRAEHEQDEIISRLEELYRQAAADNVAPREQVPLIREGALLYEELCNHKAHSDSLQGRLDSEISAANAELAIIHSSTSWKLTAPVRCLGSLLRRARDS